MMSVPTKGDCRNRPAPRGGRLKVVPYNPRAVFFRIPLALLVIGSELDPDVFRPAQTLP